LNLTGTLDLAAALQPDLRRVFVVNDAGVSGRLFERPAREQLRSFESRFEITYLSGLPTKELESRLATLPAHSMVYYLIIDRDANGENVNPLAYLGRIAALANAPTYCWVDSAMAYGIVGGRLKSQQAQVRALGELAVRVLSGEAADSIPLVTSDFTVSQVDWRQLQRWGISDARIPAGTLVRFRDPSAWERYKGYIIVAGTLLVLQTALIVGLLIQRVRLRRAEAHLRTSQTELRTSLDRSRDLGGRLLVAQEAERSRIARELHDDISQQVALLAFSVGQMDPVNVEETRRDADWRIQKIATDLRQLAHRLHPGKLQLIGLAPALKTLALDVEKTSAIDVAFFPEQVPPSLPKDVALCLFRTVQEALQNIVKHSRANNVSIDLKSSLDGLELAITDDGVGFDVEGAWRQGLGLMSMTERVEAIGGTMTIHSAPNNGTRLMVTVPLPPTAVVGV
jgi:signal transduction histidine kinase